MKKIYVKCSDELVLRFISVYTVVDWSVVTLGLLSDIATYHVNGLLNAFVTNGRIAMRSLH